VPPRKGKSAVHMSEAGDATRRSYARIAEHVVRATGD
jgi:hypothetical protein